MTPYIVVVEYQHFGWPCWRHLLVYDTA